MRESLLNRHETEMLLGRPESEGLPNPHWEDFRRIVVTGGGGSIGGALVREVLALGGCRVMAVDRDAGALAALGAHPDLVTRCADVLALEDLTWPDGGAPDAVIHTAALKDVVPLETLREEAWSVNVEGALHVAELARDAASAVFLQVSTDKASDPVGVMGATKRAAEILLGDLFDGSETRWAALRLPNVLGSSRSVIPIFRRCLREGRPLPVRDPLAARYFLGLREVVGTLLHALVGASGVCVAGVGLQTVTVGDLARRAAALWGNGADHPWEITGLLPGERRVEVLFGRDEKPLPATAPGWRKLRILTDAAAERARLGRLLGRAVERRTFSEGTPWRAAESG